MRVCTRRRRCVDFVGASCELLERLPSAADVPNKLLRAQALLCKGCLLLAFGAGTADGACRRRVPCQALAR